VHAQRLPGSPPPPLIHRIDINFVGPQEVSPQLVRANISVQVGDPFQPSSVDEDVRNLYAMGQFLNIQVKQDLSSAGVLLTYVLQAKPRLGDIRFVGNKKYSAKKLGKTISSKIGDPLDEHKLFNDSQAIRAKYQKAGYPNTQVKYVMSVDEAAGRGIATFEVQESPKIRIVDVVFDGAKAFPQKKLRKEVKTRRWWFMSWLTGSGKLKQDEFDEDKERLREFYFSNGYIDFEIRNIELPVEGPKTNRMVIRWDIFEGNQYKVGAISFKGTTMFPTNIANTILPMRPGDTFTPKGLERDSTFIEDFYGARGHIDVTEDTGNLKVVTNPNTEHNTMDLDYDVTEGQKSYVELIQIQGNWKTKDKVIRRELAISPGETFDMVKVKTSKTRLDGLQYFEKVSAKPQAREDLEANRKDLVVSVDEKSTGNVTLGAGFSSIDSLVGFVELSQGNFDLFNPPNFQGGGQKARLRLALGTQRTDAVASFVEPWFLGRKLALGVDLFYHKLDYLSVNNLFNESQGGTTLSLTKALFNDFTIGSVNYTFQNIGILNVPFYAPPALTSQEGYTMLSSVGGSVAWDSRNNTTLPDKGGRIELSTTLTGGPIGGQASFYQMELRGAWYFRGLAKGHIIEVLGRTGAGKAFDGTDDIPFYKRYYLGGLYSLRGFQYRDVSPKQHSLLGYEDQEYYGNDGSIWEPVGGDTYWFGSVEYSVPVIERLRLAAFYDIGMVYSDPFSYHTTFNPAPGSIARQTGQPRKSDRLGYENGPYASDFGFGIRINLPIGPLRLDYAIPLTYDRTTDGKGRFQFGVGYTREF
jgi:outer membrane protein insertion porin family